MRRAPMSFSAKSQRTGDSPINYFIQEAVENPNIISLAAGLVDPLTLPADAVQQALDHLLSRPELGQAALQYGTTHGHAPLRDKLLDRVMALDGVRASDLALTADHVVVTTGSQQLLYLIGELLLGAGDLVITEAPSYFVFQGILQSAGVQTLSVPVDEHGMNIDVLEELLTRLERTGELDRLRLIYVVDYFQNPTGLSLSLPRRRRLVELAQRYSRRQRIFILEDAAYRELRYDGPDLPSIKSFDRDNAHVILAMTFSKSYSPGLKTGFGILPDELVKPLLHLKGNHDFGSCNLTQHLLDRLVETGAYDRHVDRLCGVYKNKRDTVLAALGKEFAAFANTPTWTRPDGGLYVWMRYPLDVATGAGSPLLAAALKEGVLYVPGQVCYLGSGNDPIPTNELRLSFGVITPAQLQEAVHRLARAYQTLGRRTRAADERSPSARG